MNRFNQSYDQDRELSNRFYNTESNFSSEKTSVEKIVKWLRSQEVQADLCPRPKKSTSSCRS
ncbi:hypothetical protein CR194_04085 [Salipaludibacillus keqinensis]|uniref:Uncharacterized protein n=1 Tax=Salipaludibacillus keqinensis TaxID=2045207 RepID=A0A323TJI3_9BACI|nr:hypothetical protein [Salipaludibacillus keqinensis]PYZ94720.1 hypothetical protein CR194_04085 [Salipaludibacillus keqinensis]